MSEWFPLYFDVLDHERIAGANLTHLPKAFREPVREAMHGLYVRALMMLQRARSEDGLVAKHALWGPSEARRSVAEELAKVGMLEDRGEHYYPRKYLEKNRRGSQIRAATERAAERKRTSRSRVRHTSGHSLVTRDASVPPVCDCDSASKEEIKRDKTPEQAPSQPLLEVRPLTYSDNDARPPEGERFPVPCPADLELTDEARAYAEMLPLTDVDAVFAKFKRHFVAGEGAGRKAVDWLASKWRDWCHNEQAIQRREREKKREEQARTREPKKYTTMSPATRAPPTEPIAPPVDIAGMLDKLGS